LPGAFEFVDLESIAFLCIDTGVYGYPPELAASLAVRAAREALSRLPNIREVVFCCFSDTDERGRYGKLTA
jgi:O-acetyl-ADP-ribose deacetylase (regulator of RNase III)